MNCLTWQFKKDYKKDPELEDIVHWTTSVKEVLDRDDSELEVDHVPVDVNLMAAVIWREQLRELKQLRNEKKVHFRMLGNNANAEEMGEARGLDY